MTTEISKEQIQTAHDRIRDHIHRTPVLTNQWINKELGCQLFFKCENFQKGGAFKIRGATNAVFLAEDNGQNQFVTHSSGNHAQAVAIAAASRSMKATIVMPENSPAVKIAATKGYGAKVVLCPPTPKDRVSTCNKVLEETGGTLLHPFDNREVITGQATVCKEVLEDVSDLKAIIAPVGGGGLMSGTCLSANHFGDSNFQVFAAEPAGADDTYRSFQAGERLGNSTIQTIADGLLTDVGEITWPIIKSRVNDVWRVEDSWIRQAMQFYWQRMKIVVEPSGAVSLAALWKMVSSGEVRFSATDRIALVISGGNCDFGK